MEQSKSNGNGNGSMAIVERVVHDIAPGTQSGADVDLLQVIERRNKLLDKLLQYAISATHAGQWTDQDGKPYPTAAAAEVMARRCAVSIRNVAHTKTPSSDDKGPFYLYIVTCDASLPGDWDTIQAMGTCSSRDTFLGTETRAGRNLSDIDEGNILKAAYSNMMVNAVTRLLGVRNLTWEQLANVNIQREGAQKIERQSGRSGGGTTAHKDGVPVVPFGRSKGKPVTDIDDADLTYLLGRAKEDVAKNDPKWGAKNKAWLDALEAEQARRANAKAGTTAPAAPQATPWSRMVAIAKTGGVSEADLKGIIKQATGKASSHGLDDADVEKVAKAISERAKASSEADIPF
jgi:hypothetical protein